MCAFACQEKNGGTKSKAPELDVEIWERDHFNHFHQCPEPTQRILFHDRMQERVNRSNHSHCVDAFLISSGPGNGNIDVARSCIHHVVLSMQLMFFTLQWLCAKTINSQGSER